MNLSDEFDEDGLSYLELLILHATRYGALWESSSNWTLGSDLSLGT
jgi:hypothetical protein